MTYALMNTPFILAALVISFYFDRQVFRRKSTRTLLILLLVMTTIFDTYLTRMPIVGYNQDALLGVKLGTIPVEDYAYTIVLAFLPPSVWRKYGKKEDV